MIQKAKIPPHRDQGEDRYCRLHGCFQTQAIATIMSQFPQTLVDCSRNRQSLHELEDLADFTVVKLPAEQIGPGLLCQNRSSPLVVLPASRWFGAVPTRQHWGSRHGGRYGHSR
jgi:hypothetical protein